MTRSRTLGLTATAAVAAALTFAGAPPASAAPAGSWTINLACDTTGGPPEDILVVDFSFTGLTPSTSGFVTGRHVYGPGTFDWHSITNTGTTDASGARANTVESPIPDAFYTPEVGDAWDWRVFLDGEGDVLTGSTTLGGAGCASTISGSTPTISGTPKVGHTLTASPGAWSPPPVSLAYQWYADGVALGGQTGPSIALGPAHAGKAMKVKVTGSKTGFLSVAKTSAATADVALGSIAPPPQPKVSGPAKVGKKLSVVAGSWGPGVALSYRWSVGKKAVAGPKGAKPTLKLKAKHVGKKVKVTITGTRPGYLPVSRSSTATKKVRR